MDHAQSNGLCNPGKQSSFHSTYTSLCKDKNVPAILELIKSKNKLDFAADRIRADQWDIVCRSLAQDSALEFLEIRWRKSVNGENDPEKRLSPIAPLVRAVSGCLLRNCVLTKLALEGLPLTVDYVQIISTAISRNSSLKSLSFARSNIMDEGCNVICCTVRDLPHIEKLNLSQCSLTYTATDYISELIKFQTITRNSEGWMKSLRYRDVDVDSVPGLKCLILNGNQFLDRGLEIITSRLKEDMWMKAIEVQNCDISDVGGEAILDCLKFNKTLLVFDASHNYKISHKIQKKIQMILNTEPDHYEVMPKVTNSDLRETIEFLEQRLQLETFNRERSDYLNVQLHQKLVKCDQEAAEKFYQPPYGFKLIESGELNALYKEINELSLDKKATHLSDTEETVGDGKDIGEQFSIEKQCGFEEQSSFGEQSGFEEQSIFEEQSGYGEQSGFGDTLTSSERKTYASFIPFCRESKTIELNTSVSFTPYTQESSRDISSKFEEDMMTETSEEVYSTSKHDFVFEEHIGYDQFNQEIFGDGKYEQPLDCKRSDLFGLAK